ERERAAGDERRVFAQAVTRGERGLDALTREALERLQAGNMMGEQRGLSEPRAAQLLPRVLERQLGHVVADDFAGASIKVACDGEFLDEIGAHAPVLRALTGE